MEYRETVEVAAVREIKEETGLEIDRLYLLGVYSNLERDPRGHLVSVVYLAEEKSGKLRANTDSIEVVAFKRIPKKLAFDHKKYWKMH